MEKHEFTCDHCGGLVQGWLLMLSAIDIKPRNSSGYGWVTAEYRPPPLDRAYHFCCKTCIAEWAKK